MAPKVDPIIQTVRSPNLLVKAATMGPAPNVSPTMIDPTRDVIAVPW